MEITQKQKVIVAVVALAGAFAVGRFTVPEKVRIETKVVEVEKRVDQTQTDTDKHKETTVVQVKKPDGSVETTTKTVEDTDQKKDTKEVVEDKKTTDTVKEVTTGTSRLTVSALAGVNVLNLTAPPVYGLSISRPILGPVTVGAWGLSSGVGGVSLGLQF